jgi:hypothetical protein
MEFPYFILPKDTLLYRSYKQDDKRDGIWFGLKAEDTYGYGDKTVEFKTTEDIKIVDIANKLFRPAIMDVLYTISYKDTYITPYVSLLLLPLGLFNDKEVYKHIATRYGFDINKYKMIPELDVLSEVKFGGISRYSLYETDMLFIDTIKPIMSSISSGIGSMQPIPDILHGGLHHPEIILHDLNKIVFSKIIDRSMSGGSIQSTISTNEVSKMLEKINSPEYNEFYSKFPYVIAQSIDNEEIRNAQRAIHKIMTRMQFTPEEADRLQIQVDAEGRFKDIDTQLAHLKKQIDSYDTHPLEISQQQQHPPVRNRNNRCKRHTRKYSR